MVSGSTALGLDQDAAICADGQCRADSIGGLGHAYRNDHHFGSLARFAQAHCLFHRDFAEGVDGKLDVGKIDTAVVGFQPGFALESIASFTGTRIFIGNCLSAILRRAVSGGNGGTVRRNRGMVRTRRKRPPSAGPNRP
jgi:hypothetical protein